jgi:ankyrin repeat protein
MWRNLYLRTYGRPTGYKNPTSSWREYFYETTKNMSWWQQRVTSKNKCRQLSTAINHGNIRKVKNLLANGNSHFQFFLFLGVEVNCQFMELDFTVPLMIAVICNRPDIVRLLLEAGADRDISFAKNVKETPLEVCSKKKKFLMLEIAES